MYEEYLGHFSEISENIKKHAENKIFKFSRYIFVYRKGKQQYGYCTHCGKEFKTEGLRHNRPNIMCPHCRSNCTVKSSGRGRKYMIDEAYFIYYEKSIKEPNVIVARGIYAERDYSFDYHNVKTQYADVALYVFKIGKSVMLRRNVHYNGKSIYRSVYEKARSIYSVDAGGYFANKNVISDCAYESIEHAVEDTPFRFSTWQEYKGGDMLKFFELYSKYPGIEYLTKTGFKNLVTARLANEPTYSSVNWRGKTLNEILKLNRKEIKDLRKSEFVITPLFLKLYQISESDGSNLSLKEISKIEYTSNCYFNYYFKRLKFILKYTSLRKSINYIDKQYAKYAKNFYEKQEVLIAWKDYIDDCIKLGMDTTEDNVIFPKDIYTTHQNTIKQIKIKENKEIDIKIKKRIKYLEKYCFEYNQLLIRPALSTKDLIEEGKTLHHCVASNYTERYASGETNIFLIRKVSDLNKPYFTLELYKGSVTQVRGKNNCGPNKEVSEFVEFFKEQKLKKKQNLNRILVSA